MIAAVDRLTAPAKTAVMVSRPVQAALAGRLYIDLHRVTSAR